MSPNRQVFPSSLFPLRGDISAEAGATSVTVTGIQGIPVISPPVEPEGNDTLFYNSYSNDWYYASPWDIPIGTVLEFEGYGYNPVGISWLAPDTIAIGDGTQGDVSGAAAMTALILFGSPTYDYGYDQNYTTLYSGATTDWNLVLPANGGVTGQVLTIAGESYGTTTTEWATPQVTVTPALVAPTSAGTAGTLGQIISYSGMLYICSATGSAGHATWNEFNLTPV